LHVASLGCSFYTIRAEGNRALHIYLDLVLLTVALISSGLFAVAAEPRTRTLVFGASLISFVGGLVIGHWM
jgi:hypothetical protein